MRWYFLISNAFKLSKAQSRAQSSPAPQSAVGRRGELWGHEIFTGEIVRFRFLCACLGFIKTEVITKSTSTYFSHYVIEKGGISVKLFLELELVKYLDFH